LHHPCVALFPDRLRSCFVVYHSPHPEGLLESKPFAVAASSSQYVLCPGRRHTLRGLQRPRSFQTHTFRPLLPLQTFDETPQLPDLQPRLLQFDLPFSPRRHNRATTYKQQLRVHRLIACRQLKRYGSPTMILKSAWYMIGGFGIVYGPVVLRLRSTTQQPSSSDSLFAPNVLRPTIAHQVKSTDDMFLGLHFLPSPANLRIACEASAAHCTA